MARMIRRISRLIALLPLALAACAPPAPAHYAPPSFAQLQPFNLDVATVNVVAEYKASVEPPHVEGLFTVTPGEAMRQWIKDRIHGVGSDNTLTIIIKDASVTETNLPPHQGPGTFTYENGKRYDARLEVEMRIYGGDSAISEASTNAVATRSDTLPANASLADKRALFDRMTSELMNVMNAQLEKNIYTYFNGYLRYDSGV